MTNVEHAVAMPLFGACPPRLLSQLQAYLDQGFAVVLVQNNPPDQGLWPLELAPLNRPDRALRLVANHNQGGVAGGFNRGVEVARAAGARWITLLDQDSALAASDLVRLREPWEQRPAGRFVVGPRIWDQRRQKWQGRPVPRDAGAYLQTRLLISSGTTFQAADWPEMGSMCEWLVVDFVDHSWSFQLQQRGFDLWQHPGVALAQSFGSPHPNWLCDRLGMQLYSPMRHYYSLRNLRWLVRQPEVPVDLKCKEVIKMLFKPWMWLLFEPRRIENMRAIVRAFRSPLETAAQP